MTMILEGTPEAVGTRDVAEVDKLEAGVAFSSVVSRVLTSDERSLGVSVGTSVFELESGFLLVGSEGWKEEMLGR